MFKYFRKYATIYIETAEKHHPMRCTTCWCFHACSPSCRQHAQTCLIIINAPWPQHLNQPKFSRSAKKHGCIWAWMWILLILPLYQQEERQETKMPILSDTRRESTRRPSRHVAAWCLQGGLVLFQGLPTMRLDRWGTQERRTTIIDNRKTDDAKKRGRDL